MKTAMEIKRQSYWWWFDNHNSPSCSPWLQSTLAELNEKTKSMLKLIDEDADSFAQRAEMYYKKRPELISIVEDFYKAHRSLAERYDILRTDMYGRVKSPLHNFFSSPSKDTPVSVIGSVKSYDSESFAEVYNSEECAESEIDDPEVVDDHSEHSVSEGLSCDELMNLKEELERLQKENNAQREQIEVKDREIKGLMAQLYGNINELKNLRGEMETTIFALKEKSSEIVLSKCEIEKKEMEKKEEEAKYELMKKVREETAVENMNLKSALAEKDEEKREVIRQLSMAIEMLQEENQILKSSITKDGRSNGTLKRWNMAEKQIFKGVDLSKLFGFWSKCQTSVVPL